MSFLYSKHQTWVEFCCQCTGHLYHDRTDVTIVGESCTWFSSYYCFLRWNVHNSIDWRFAGAWFSILFISCLPFAVQQYLWNFSLFVLLQFSRGNFDGVEQYARNKRIQVRKDWMLFNFIGFHWHFVMSNFFPFNLSLNIHTVMLTWLTCLTHMNIMVVVLLELGAAPL